jgi:hypothetical protein
MQFKQYLLIALILIAANTANAQAVSQLDYEGRQNYGLKMGMGINSMYGGKLQNPRPTIGFMAGLYIHSNPEKKRSPFGLQSGIDLRMRGSNFANGKTGDTAINRAYTKISIMSLDVPLLVNYRLSKQRDKQIKQLQFGLQMGYNFNSVLYVGPQKRPLPTAFNTYNSIKEWDRLPIKLYDLQAVAGYQYRGETLGYSVSMKMGLLNLNDNFVIRGMVDTDNDGIEDKEIELISPTTDPLKEKPGTRQMIGTWSLELALVF